MVKFPNCAHFTSQKCSLATERYFLMNVKSQLYFLIFQNYEMIVLEALQWDLSAVTPYSILDQILRSVQLESNPNESNVRKHAETFVALAATESHFIHKSPALIAVASLGAALRGLNHAGLEAMLTAVYFQCGVQRVSYQSPFLIPARGNTFFKRSLFDC